MIRQSLKFLYRTIRKISYSLFYYIKKTHVPWSSYADSGAIINNSVIGKYCYVGPNTVLNNVRLGNYCSIGPGVQIGGMEHSWWYGSTSTAISCQCIEDKKTIIEDDVWIGANAVVKQGVRIGRGAVIGAGAVVLTDVLSYSIVVGVPAREKRKRFSEAIIGRIERSEFWLFDPEEAKRKLDSISYD